MLWMTLSEWWWSNPLDRGCITGLDLYQVGIYTIKVIDFTRVHCPNLAMVLRLFHTSHTLWCIKHIQPLLIVVFVLFGIVLDLMLDSPVLLPVTSGKHSPPLVYWALRSLLIFLKHCTLRVGIVFFTEADIICKAVGQCWYCLSKSCWVSLHMCLKQTFHSVFVAPRCATWNSSFHWRFSDGLWSTSRGSQRQMWGKMAADCICVTLQWQAMLQRTSTKMFCMCKYHRRLLTWIHDTFIVLLCMWNCRITFNPLTNFQKTLQTNMQLTCLWNQRKSTDLRQYSTLYIHKSVIHSSLHFS